MRKRRFFINYPCLVRGATARRLEQAEAAGDGGYHGDAQTAGGARGAEGGCNGGDRRRRTAEETFRGNIVFFCSVSIIFVKFFLNNTQIFFVHFSWDSVRRVLLQMHFYLTKKKGERNFTFHTVNSRRALAVVSYTIFTFVF